MCIFCDIIDHKIPSAVVYEDEKVLAILDISQVTYGHTLVMPKKHMKNIIEADDESVIACVSTARKLAGQIVTNCRASGVNILTNCGESAGQTVEHLHFHIIPRYDEGDCIDIKFNESPKQDLEEVLKTVKG
ncbi:MAG: HIT family protein [Erysipelotrichaceae bacterium]|jgi:histidine triad (HIT) family protein|nr:HIT family protein [Erysipelotrichaceae bacterium]MDO5108398.1 HIT family protein [Erysipelotrichaceae bacterium]